MGDKDGWRRIGAGICLVGAPLVILVAMLVHAGLREGPAEDALETIRGASDRWFTGVVLGLVGFTLLIGAVLAVVHLCRRGGADGWGLVGGTVTIIGLSAVIAIQSLELLLWLMSRPGQNAVAMTALAADIDGSNRLALVYLVSLGFFVGFLILAYGLYRSQTTPGWVPAVLAVGVVAFGAGIIPGIDALDIIGAALMLIALGYVGVQAFQGTGAWDEASGEAAVPPG